MFYCLFVYDDPIMSQNCTTSLYVLVNQVVTYEQLCWMAPPIDTSCIIL